MKLTYQGPFDAVVIPSLGDLLCARGQTVEVPDEIGEQLLDQGDNWAKPKPASRTSKEKN